MDGEIKPERVAVLLMAYGAAEGLSELPEYLRHILGGRPVPEKLLDDVTGRYRAIGGRSPLIDITREQARRLEERLNADHEDAARFRVYVGMWHSKPTIRSAVEELSANGHALLVAVPMTPYYSKMSVGAYMRALDEAMGGSRTRVPTLRVESWHDEPLLIEAFVEKTLAAFERVPAELRGDTALLLTAHSLPERVLAEGDPYQKVLMETAEAVAKRTGMTRWKFAYQSRGGGGREPWLGPDAGEVIKGLARDGAKSVVLSPIGFLSEHMETLYDDDVHYRGIAREAGLCFERAEAVNAAPKFIAALAETVRKKMRGA